MSLLYSCITRESVVLVEKSLGGSYSDVVSNVISDTNFNLKKKTTVPSNDLLIHTSIEDGFCYLCVSNKEMGRRVPYIFLESVKTKLKDSGNLYQRAQMAQQFEFNRSFSGTLQDTMTDFNEGKGDKLSTLQNQVGEVTGVMKQNMEKVMERGDKLDDLVDKSEQLEQGASMFKTTSVRISRKYYWQNKKMMIIIGIVVTVIIVLIILFATGVI